MILAVSCILLLLIVAVSGRKLPPTACPNGQCVNLQGACATEVPCNIDPCATIRCGFGTTCIANQCGSCTGACLTDGELYADYYVGNGPIIFSSLHGGYEKPANIPPRQAACYNAGNPPECNWTQPCTNPNNDRCAVKNQSDSWTKEIAECLQSITTLTVENDFLRPSLIVNNLHRSRLDANRQKEEAAQGNIIALNVFDQIHKDDTGYLWQAKNSALKKCGWGIIFDIHAQIKNDYNHLAYRLQPHHLDYGDDKISGINGNSSWYKDRSSIKWLIDNNRQNINNDYADIVRGPYSLGSILEGKTTGNNGNGENYKVIPSISTPNTNFINHPNKKYYAGNFSLKYHGSSLVNELNNNDAQYYTPNTKSNIIVDTIQIEINSDIRKNENGASRDQFCVDFSEAIITFIEHWYDTSTCSAPSPTAAISDIFDIPDNNNIIVEPEPYYPSQYNIIIIVLLMISSIILLFNIYLTCNRCYNKTCCDPERRKRGYKSVIRVDSEYDDDSENNPINC